MSGLQHVAVVGAGIAGLTAAVDCARVGIRVTVLEAAPVAGGNIGSAELAGVRLDTGAESYASRGGAVAELVASLGLDDASVTPNPAGSWLRTGAGKCLPSPKTGILGIPSNPFAEDVRAVIGWSGAWRAYLDRLKPVLAIGAVHNLGDLVEKRMGKRVLNDLVAPVTRGVYSTDPSEIDVAVAIPGLNSALTRTGSLSGAVLQLRGNAKPGAMVASVRGGMSRIVDELVAELTRREGDLRLETAVTGLRAEGERWSLDLGDEETLTVDHVILAAPEAATRALIGAAAGIEEASSLTLDPIEIVSIVLDAPELDSAPRGSGILIADAPDIAAKALTHSSAKWSFVAEAFADHPGRHALRLSYGRQGQPNPLAGLDDDDVRTLAMRDVSTIFGFALGEDRVVDLARTVWSGTRPAAAIGRAALAADVADAIRALPGIDATGAWLAGTGLAAVVPDALNASGRVRRAVANHYLTTGDLPDATGATEETKE